MAKAKYAFQGMKESMAKAMKRDVELSMKVAIEMSSFLKGRSTTEAKTILERVLTKTQAIPFKKFNDGVGHRKGAGIAAGRYPQKGASIFIELIESAEANAQAKGLSTSLKIIHLAPQKPSGAFHYGRLRRRKFKRSHLEIVVQELEKESKPKQPKKESQKQTSAVEKPAAQKKEDKSKEHKPKEEKLKEQVQENKETQQAQTKVNSESKHRSEASSISDKSEKPKKKVAPKKSQEDKQ
ncbi:MAG: 50S ribosomal protein L22 [Candidatus Nanoarchaeia archaeon]